VNDAGGTGSDDDFSRCTSVLLSVPREIASRIESFLRANDIPCRIGLNTEMTPERLAEEYLSSSARDPSGLLDAPVLGPLLRGRLGRDLKAEIKVVGSEIPPVWDVLVRPEDMPDDLRADVVPSDTPTPAPQGSSGGEPPQAALELVVLCELPWEEAWRLTERLIGDGIPAAVMASERTDRDRPMGARIVPVGVRPDDLDRARASLE
jgi:hypothetical protein